MVKDYRLIGFDNRKDAITDSSSVLDGGEVGSGHHTMAVFEIIPETMIKDSSAEFASLSLQYHLPNAEKILTQRFTMGFEPQDFISTAAPIRFATAVAMFGSLLKQSRYAKFSYEDVLTISTAAADSNSKQQQEFITLVQKADKVYNFSKKKRK